MTEHQVFLIGGVVVGLCLLIVWASGRRSGRKSVKAIREVTRASGTVVRSVVAGAVIVGLQWLVLRFGGSTAMWVALGLPALLAGVTAARLFAVTEVVHTTRRGRGRR